MRVSNWLNALVEKLHCNGRQDYQWKHEPVLYGWKEGAAHNWYSDRKQTTIIEFNKPLRSEDHPTMKPVDLFTYLKK
jgi:site-specific DNA-methyltransferase (adenine-specific)